MNEIINMQIETKDLNSLEYCGLFEMPQTKLLNYLENSEENSISNRGISISSESKKQESILCACGCGRETNIIRKTDKKRGYIKGEYSSYISGHNQSWLGKHLSEMHKQKCRLAKLGKHPSEETKRNMSLAQLRRKERDGYIHSQESRKKLSIKLKGKIRSEETRNNISKAKKGRTYEEVFGIKKTKELKENLRNKFIGEGNPFYGKHHTKETIEKLKSEENIKKRLQGLFKRPTSFEKKIIDLCNRHSLPFKYVGDGQVIIGYKNPDFIETNGKKILMEVYNNFHHKDNYEQKRGEHFKKYGYDTIFIGEEEVLADNWEERCLNKINDVLSRNAI